MICMARLSYTIEYAEAITDAYDSVVVVGENLKQEHYAAFTKPYLQAIKALSANDQSVLSNVTATSLAEGAVKFMVWSPTGPVNRDYDDVRRYQDAALAGIKRALRAGKESPLLVVYHADQHLTSTKYKDALLVSLLAACEAVYVPIEVREAQPEKATKINKLGINSLELKKTEGDALVEKAVGIEIGRVIARDIGGSDPERMSAERTEQYVAKMFKDTCIKINVTKGQDAFEKDYPLFAAVNRCADHIERHRGRIIYLEYCGDEIKETYLFVGKGVTYDTGGADVKAGGHMAGMHRDKCGAATVAGIFGMLAHLKPKGVKVVGRMAMVRNSIGADAYVADEIITSAAGVRVRVGNTDAEGRMAMTDPLHHTKQQALEEVKPHLFTIATLTGHAIIAMGDAYSIVLDNGPAEVEGFARHIQQIGASLSNPFEVSMLRREDYNFVAGRNEYEDVIQCNNKPSSGTPRGHQFPAAFMIRSSGLDKHGIDSDRPLKYSHVDIAGSSGPYPGMPTAAPLIAFGRLMKAF
ncbi:putative aminopeptidase W07G4.4 isoform X2 [Hydractinia symbiolongicarpus]|uniref:putative aminopeptidase W07G4.4 isoform X2 n=1 Tax=Hydractinia symbiolongicarpus TaxID=13093 RepID=UPI0025509FD9|nr:putative aminopeptidase W07G4.4 isoform X2 [Hydractinia symbiolongicarpus]